MALVVYKLICNLVYRRSCILFVYINNYSIINYNFSLAVNLNLYISNMWVFGYGSLVWKVDFPFEYKIVGYVKGFQRRFYQHSTDHRGTPEKPGRVVTLLPSSNIDAEVWGIAYKIGEADAKKVIDHLDYREKGGYIRQHVLFYPKDSNICPFEITIYVGTEDNFQFAGAADVAEIAKQIVASVGPSGSNIEYLLNLANAMRDIAPEIDDEHLFCLETCVLNLLGKNSNSIFQSF